MLTDPPIYHITHLRNLPGILQQGGLFCDAQRLRRELPSTNIGHLHIKQRRLNRLVKTRSNGTLGEYVPFNFCPRSVMLYAVSRGHQDYDGGQEQILHLCSSVAVASALGRPIAFTDRHADLAHALFFDELTDLDQVPWSVMEQRFWAEVKEQRQAEFLVHGFFPWTAIQEVAAMTPETATQAEALLQATAQPPPVRLRPAWYY